jgi:hypothetical protein
MTWRVVEKEKGLGITFGQAFKNVHCQIDLYKEVFSAEISIAILASLEDNPSLPENKLVQGKGKDGNEQTHCHHASGPTQTSRSPRS